MNDPAFAKQESGYAPQPEPETLPVPELSIPSAPAAPAPGGAAPAEPSADVAADAVGTPYGGEESAMPDGLQAPLPPEPAGTADFSVQTNDPALTAGERARPVPRINIQAFCEDQRTAQVLQAASEDRRLAKAHVTVQMGGIEAATAFYGNAPTPNLIVIESMHKRDALLVDLARLAEVCDSGTKVVVIGHVNDVLLYRELLQRGVSEYLVMPLSVGQVMECISSLYTDPSAEPLGQVIAFIGAKGGVGSSTVCHNVAWAISEVIKSDVVIADFDLPFGTAGLDFNQDPVQGLADALNAPDRVDEVLLDRLLSRCTDHLSLFAAPGTLDQPYDVSSTACDTVIDVLRKNVPFIAADLPHMWAGWTRQIATQADRIVVVAAPDLANLRNAKNLMDKLVTARPNDAPPLLVLNQVGVAKRPEISAKDFASALSTEVEFIVEFDAALFGTASNNGQMIGEVSGKAKPAEQFRDLALSLTGRSEAKAEQSSLLAPILARLHGKKTGK